MLSHLVPILLKRRASAGSLSSDGGHSTVGEDCTAAGYADYLVVGAFSSTNERKIGANLIAASFTLTGGASRGNNSPTTPTDATYTGTDSTPTGTFSVGSNAEWTVTGAGDKVSTTAPAGTASKTAKFAIGVYNNDGSGTATATIRAHLSDSSATDTSNTLTSGAGALTFKEYTFTYTAASAGQTLTLSIEATSASSAITNCVLFIGRITYL